jgi:hypothetical protein
VLPSTGTSSQAAAYIAKPAPPMKVSPTARMRISATSTPV